MSNKTCQDKCDRQHEDCNKELCYLRKITEQSMAKIITSDAQSLIVKHELEQKKRCFSLMAELGINFGTNADFNSIFLYISRCINDAMSMERTVILTPSADDKKFRASFLHGYSKAEQSEIEETSIKIPDKMLDPVKPILANKHSSSEDLADIKKFLKINFFISAPILLHNEIVAIIITGRNKESALFIPKLSKDDQETLHAMCIYVGYMLTGQRLLEAENLAYYDPLTQLPNLRRTKEGLNQIIKLSKRGNYTSAIMFVDLDGFKEVNDSYGHAAGDRVLKTVARRMVNSVRESDFVGRYGGDEFIVALAHIGMPEDAGLVAAKMLNKISEPIHIGDNNYCRIGASIGIALFPEHGNNAATLLKAADDIMYGVKKKGKNAFMIYQAGELNDNI